VLINGASGGVGTFAIQIARALGASHVTAVCSTTNVQIARDLGADRVVDYTREDFSRSGEKFDLLFDNAGSWSLTACRGLLTEKGTFVMVTGKKGQWIAPVGRLIAGRIRALAWSQSIANDVAQPVRADLETLGRWWSRDRCDR
jgi:NADPH:quinone reductase-like Zn-dependent oxidoreductase